MQFNSYRIDDIKAKLRLSQSNCLHIMVAGATGAGKSTTLNALLQKKIARVGEGVDPQTMELNRYEFNDVLRIWDTPGLGDDVKRDQIHQEKMVDLLEKTYSFDEDDYGLIDMVLVIIDGSSRDLGTTYTLLNKVISPNIDDDRILVVINQADMAMSGRHWNYETNTPDSKLIEFLDRKAISTQVRIKEATGISIVKPVYYSAKFGYNLQTVLDFIIDHMPMDKRELYFYSDEDYDDEDYDDDGDNCYSVVTNNNGHEVTVSFTTPNVTINYVYNNDDDDDDDDLSAEECIENYIKMMKPPLNF